MGQIACPHCAEKIPEGSRVCYRCLRDLKPGAQARGYRAEKVARPKASRPLLGPSVYWLVLRLLYAAYGALLVHDFFEMDFAEGPRLVAQLIMPVVTLGLVVLALVRVQGSAFLWTLIIASLQTIEAVRATKSGEFEVVHVVLAIVLWLLALWAPRADRVAAGRDRGDKFAADDRSVVGATLIVFIGTLLVVLLSGLPSGLVGASFFWGGVLIVSLLAARVDGYRLTQLPFGMSLRGLLIALGGGAVACLYIWWITYLGVGQWIPTDLPLRLPEGFLGATLWLHVCVAPPLFEEIQCRGVLWQASIQRASTGATILLTATMFSLFHLWALPEGHGLPPQFIPGLLLGWVRAKAGSVAPCMLVHFIWNMFWIALAYGIATS